MAKRPSANRGFGYASVLYAQAAFTEAYGITI